MTTDDDADIVEIIMQLAQAAGLSVDAALGIEKKIRLEYGGMRVRIPKTKKHLSQEQRAAAIRDGLSNVPTEEICKKHRIDRASLYRLLKRGG